MENLIFRVCENEDIFDVIEFCNLNGFTPRTVEDWLGGNIQAALVWDKDQLIGAIPFYRRKINIGNDYVSECGHFTAVAIDENWRSKGLGSALLKYVINNFDLDALYVNSSEDDLAYKWYQRNGFEKLSDVSFYKLDSGDNFIKNSNITVQKLCVELLSDHLTGNLLNAFSIANANYGGFEKRDFEFWKKKLKYHYYRSYNEYYLISDTYRSSSPYIIASINSYPGREKSIDVLEFAFEDEKMLSSLIIGLQEMGSSFEINKIRFPLNNQSSVSSFLKNKGFLEDGNFSILYYSIKNQKKNTLRYRYFHFDYA
jgi:ribosomal protein S18 acetylase RimI-like enzyme